MSTHPLPEDAAPAPDALSLAYTDLTNEHLPVPQQYDTLYTRPQRTARFVRQVLRYLGLRHPHLFS